LNTPNNLTAHGFTKPFNGITNVISTGVGIDLPFSFNSTTSFSTIAIWDTGATGTAITKVVAQKLGLKPIGKVIAHGANGPYPANVYFVSIALPNKIVIPQLRVTELEALTGDFEVLIGMDIISSGDLSISNFGGQTIMSFRMPSIGHIDLSKNYVTVDKMQPPQKSGINKKPHTPLEKLPPPEKKHFTRSERREQERKKGKK